jgi:hypothetical protein
MSTLPQRDADRDADPQAHPAVRQYVLVCVSALVVVVMVLAVRGSGWTALLPLLAGGAAAVAGWSAGPLLVIACVGVLLRVRAREMHSGLIQGLPDALPLDLALAAAVLVYVVAQYRIQSLLRHVFPPDPRRRPLRRRPTARLLPPVHEPRSPDLVGPGEAARLVLGLLLVAGLAAMLWAVLSQWPPPWGFGRRAWVLLVLAWSGLAVVGMAFAVAGWQRMDRACPEEALMYLQDQLWRETRREQSRLNRWLVWARLRRQRAARREKTP